MLAIQNTRLHFQQNVFLLLARFLTFLKAVKKLADQFYIVHVHYQNEQGSVVTVLCSDCYLEFRKT